MRTLVLSAITAAALTLGFPAWGDAVATAEHDPAAAETLFRQGKDAAKRGDWPTACKSFAASLKLDAAPGTLLNLADCEEHEHQMASAWEHFVKAGDQLRRGDERIPYARARAQALEKRVPHITVKLAPNAPPGTRVSRGDVELDPAVFGMALPVDPGEYVLVVTAPDHQEQRFSIKLVEGESQEIVVEPGEPAAKGASGQHGDTTTTTAPSGGIRLRTVGWVLGGVGVAGVAVGAVTGLLAISQANTYRANCDPSGACQQPGLDAASSGKTYATVSTVSFAGGAAVLALGTVLILVGGNSASQVTGVKPPGGNVGFMTMPGGAGLTWQGAFW